MPPRESRRIAANRSTFDVGGIGRAPNPDPPMLPPDQVAPELANIETTRSGRTGEWLPKSRTNPSSSNSGPLRSTREAARLLSAAELGRRLRPCLLDFQA